MQVPRRAHIPASHEIRELRVAVAGEQLYAVRGHGFCWCSVRVDGVVRCSHVEGWKHRRPQKLRGGTGRVPAIAAGPSLFRARFSHIRSHRTACTAIICQAYMYLY